MQRRDATNPVGRVPPTLEIMHGEWEHSVFGSLQLLRMAVIFFTKHCGKRWLGSRVVSVPDSGAEGPGFKLQSRDALSDNSLRQTVHTRRASVHQAAKLVAALLRVAGVTAGLAESKGSLSPAGFMTHITCRLTAKNRDQLQNPIRSVIEYGLPFYCGKLTVLPETSLLNLGEKERRVVKGMGETLVEQYRETGKGRRGRGRGLASTPREVSSDYSAVIASIHGRPRISSQTVQIRGKLRAFFEKIVANIEKKI